MVTAGLKCAPEMWLKARERMAMAIPDARAMPSGPAPFDCRKRSVQMAPAPKKTSAKVPRNSAVSFCEVLYTGISRVQSEERLDSSKSWNEKRGVRKKRIDAEGTDRRRAAITETGMMKRKFVERGRLAAAPDRF